MLETTRRTRRSNLMVDRYVGTQIRIRRKERRMSQTDLANRLGVTFQQVQKYENGTNSVRAERLMQLSRVLDVPLTYFFERTEGTGQIPEAQQFLSTTDGMTIAKAFVAMPAGKLRRSVAEVIEGIARLCRR